MMWMKVKSKLAQVAYGGRNKVPRKFINNRILNTLGLQVLRTTSAHFIHGLRPDPKVKPLSGPIELLRDNGIAMIPDFLEKTQFHKVLQEYEEAFRVGSADDFRYDQKGSTVVKFFPMFSTPECEKRFPAITKAIMRNKTLVDLFAAAECRNKLSIDFCELQQLYRRENANASEVDYESFLHQDTFFPTFKAWIYLDDVGSEDGPLIYVPGTHKLTVERLAFEHKNSVAAQGDGSWRVTDGFLEKLGHKPTPFECKANTLVLANTYGFHARRQIQAHRVRKAIHISMRFNPWSLL